MTAARRDALCLGAAAALLVVGVAGWWRLPVHRSVTVHADLPMLALWVSAAGVIAAIAWFLGHPAGTGWSPLIATLTLAATAPLSVVPLVMSVVAGSAARVGLTLASLAVLPFALHLAGWIARPEVARPVRWVAAACVAAAVLAVVGTMIPGGGPAPWDGFLASDTHYTDPWGARWLLLGGAALIPGLAASASTLSDPSVPLGSPRRVVTAGILAGASILPVVTGVSLVSQALWPALIIPVAAALATVFVLTRLAIGPLARDAGVAAGQRDLVIAASESERLRLATTLHDGPLGDVALLVQRLDAAGDTENATLARAIADELRDVGNDLRLPLVEDLGVSAGLEWLVERLTRTTGEPIALTVVEDGRPPADVEAAVYRIAQEALVNAIRHGAPPVDVHYESRPDVARLTVSDHGPGIDADATERALRQGRLGLLMVRHRADAIGAALSVAARVDKGTTVDVSWQRLAG